MIKYVVLLIVSFLIVQSNAQSIEWRDLQNPFYYHEGWSVKDACMVFNEDNTTFYIFFSAFYFDNGRERSHISAVKTQNFKDFSAPLFIWDGQEEGWIGMCSPNIIKIKNKYILTYNSWGNKKGQPNQLFYAESYDLENWNKHLPLAKNITSGVRSIDAALIYHNEKYFLVWKRIQTPQLSFCDSLSSNRWVNMGELNIGWFENGQFILIDDELFLACTARQHKQYIYKKENDTGEIWDFTKWNLFSEVKVPEEKFNTDERMNAGFLVDYRKFDGYYYYIYAGRTENVTHAGRGDNKLGIARSKNLKIWDIPDVQ